MPFVLVLNEKKSLYDINFQSAYKFCYCFLLIVPALTSISQLIFEIKFIQSMNEFKPCLKNTWSTSELFQFDPRFKTTKGYNRQRNTWKQIKGNPMVTCLSNKFLKL